MPLSRSERLQHKAESALFGAIEVYNKPDFKYREETFAILMLNAWELLLKAKLLADKQNDLKSLWVYETKPTKSGGRTKNAFVKKNRTGNPSTKGIRDVIKTLDQSVNSKIDRAIQDNINALLEIRDNAIHFFNASTQLAKQVQEIGTASVVNFVECSRKWFDLDLTRYNLYLMPVGFTSAVGAQAMPSARNESNLVKFLSKIVTESDAASAFHVSLVLDVRLQRAEDSHAIIQQAKPGEPATKVIVELSEEEFRKQYSLDHRQLLERCHSRYSDFKANPNFYRVRQPLMNDQRYVRLRYLDPANPKSGKKAFYSPNIFQELDKAYTRA